jgi:NADPH:quinone reductase-like Zn-dependent oxidoreductase
VRTIVVNQPGGYGALADVERPDPVPAEGELRIDVEACGVNYADSIVRMGLYASARQLHGYPITPGFEVAGRIAGIGPGVDGWQVGERVMALTLFGGYTSAICLPARRVFRIPDALSTIQAAAVPTVFLTAWFMVHQQLHPRAGETWLVHSAAGGVGSAVAQLGRLAGCRVIGVVRGAHKIDAARTAGCTEVIDKSIAAPWAMVRNLAPHGYDAVFDANGVETLSRSYDLLAPTGRLLIYGFASMLPRDGRVRWWRLAWDWLRTPRFNPLQMTQSNRSVLACNLSFLSAQADRLSEGMQWLLARFERGELLPPPIETFALHDAAAAQRRIESGATVGKLVLLP